MATAIPLFDWLGHRGGGAQRPWPARARWQWAERDAGGEMDANDVLALGLGITALASMTCLIAPLGELFEST